MIQRIQSIFLLLASGAFFALFAIPFASSNTKDDALFQDGIYNIFDNPILLVLTILGGILALINIFLFKKRDLQIKLDFGVMTLAIMLLAATLIIVFQSGKLSSESFEINENYLGLSLPIISIVFAILANRFIKKDHKLVKSMDRLR